MTAPQWRIEESTNDALVRADVRAVIRNLVDDCSIEILPREAEKKIGDGRSHLRRGTRVYIAYTAGCHDEVVNAAQIVHEAGFVPVPHIPARRFGSLPEIRGFIESLAKRASVRQVLLIGGDNQQPAGPFQSTIHVLQTGLLQAHGIETFGVAGHPDGHPLIGREMIRQALLEKHDYAAKCGMKLYVVTQFLFDTQKLLAWHADFIEHTIPGVPIDVGLPGLAKATTLLRFAKECGVATSLGMLTRNPARALRLATSFSPEESLIDLALDARRAGRSRFRSMHFFPFGSFDRTTEWLEALAAGNFRVDQSARAIHPI